MIGASRYSNCRAIEYQAIGVVQFRQAIATMVPPPSSFIVDGLIDGKAVAAQIRAEVAATVRLLKEQHGKACICSSRAVPSPQVLPGAAAAAAAAAAIPTKLCPVCHAVFPGSRPSSRHCRGAQGLTDLCAHEAPCMRRGRHCIIWRRLAREREPDRGAGAGSTPQCRSLRARNSCSAAGAKHMRASAAMHQAQCKHTQA
jgi:hypothetical protein